jgi:glycine C-acetyltransferase
MVETIFQKALTDLTKDGLKRDLRSQSGPHGRSIIIDGKNVLNFCSNNYLGLADDPRLKEAAAACLKEEGVGAGASRLVGGNMASHRRLEEALARFKGTESCLLFSTGYMANIGIIPAIFGRGDIVFSDRLNHASMTDGILLSRAEFRRYPHKDMNALGGMLRSASGFKKRGIVTDSVFSMDGDIAPLKEIAVLAQKYECLVMIDEAHALGVMGKTGRGLAEHFGVEDQIAIQMGTLSKAAGCFGAYCCGSRTLISFLINRARSFMYTTGMPPSIAAASLRAIEIIEDEPALRQRLWENAHGMKKALDKIGFDTGESRTPIIPVIVGESERAVAFSNRLLEEGIFASAIRPPTVPPNTARLRLTVMAVHTREDLDDALEKLERVGRELGII